MTNDLTIKKFVFLLFLLFYSTDGYLIILRLINNVTAGIKHLII